MEGTDHALTTWRTSTYSGSNGGDCGAAVMVRDTKNRAGAVLTIAPGAWRALLAGVRAS